MCSALIPCPSLMGAAFSAWEFKGTNQADLEFDFRRSSFLPQNSIQPSANYQTVQIPDLSGVLQEFEIEDAGIIPHELARKFPTLQAFRGRSIDGEQSIRIELNEEGISAWINGQGDSFVIQSAGSGSKRHRLVRETSQPSGLLECHPLEMQTPTLASPASPGLASTSGQNLRAFRIALAASGEFSQANGGTVSSTLAAIVTILNRVNEIYERELAVRLELIPNNDQIIFLNPATDPYTRNDSSELTINEVHTNLLAVIGNANFDLGMAFNTSLYGLAYLRSVCDPNTKGRGVIGTATTSSENFFRVVAHEIGHQFGAGHTFNGNQGHCAIARNGFTAFEPGSGSTLMGYAGIGCLSDEIQPIIDTYFHTKNFEQIQNFLSGANCARLIPTGNRPPSVSGGPNYNIPRGTPFRLTATGSDPDNDPLLFCWEQTDIGPAQALSEPDNGQSPLFRSFPPTNSPTRVFPRWQVLLANQNDPAEKLPQTDRVLHFQVSARDQKLGGAGVAWSRAEVTVDAGKGPFRIVAPNGGERWSGTQTILWDPSGTTGSPVNAATVNIRLSTNGGASFDHPLVLNTPNDGSETVALPQIAIPQARIMVEAASNIFFDISDQGFEISAPPASILLQSARVGEEIILRFPTLPGRLYRIQYKDTLFGPWGDFTKDLAGTGGILERRDLIRQNTNRFYRVWLKP